MNINLANIDFAPGQGGGGDAVWGSITGTITDQTDLVDYVTSGVQTIVNDMNCMKLVDREGVEFPVVDRPDGNQDDPDYYSTSSYIIGLEKNSESTYFVYAKGSALCFIDREYVEEDGEMVLSKEWEGEFYKMYPGYNPIENCSFVENPDFTDNPVPENYPISDCINNNDGNLNIGYIDTDDWTFNGIKLNPENNEYGLYKITPVEDGSEITYEESFIPFIAAEAPAADGTYVLKATVQDGEVTYEWIPEV